jgi:hypothetical protein
MGGTGLGATTAGGVPLAEIEAAVSGVAFPADREDLVRTAESGGASRGAVDALSRLPDRAYRDVPDLRQEFARSL